MVSVWEKIKRSIEEIAIRAGRLPSQSQTEAKTDPDRQEGLYPYVFDDFKQATCYAKSQAIKRRVSVKIESNGQSWVVLGDISPSSEPDGASMHQAPLNSSPSGSPVTEKPSWIPDAEYWKTREEKCLLAEETNLRFEYERISRLNERKKIQEAEDVLLQEQIDLLATQYRLASLEKLKELWNNRDEANLSSLHQQAVRAVLREKMGIVPTPTTYLVCPNCLMVGDSCICRKIID